MKTNKKAESLALIIVSIFLLSFIILGILNIIGFSQSSEDKYRSNVFLDITKWNSENLIKKLELPNLKNNEIFYIKKDKDNKKYVILTGSENEQYKYINFLGDNVDPNSYEGTIYTRTFIFKKDILRHSISPNEIPNLSFWYDSTNINGDNNNGLNDGDEIDLLKDLSGNGNNAYQNTSGKKPKLVKQAIKDKDGLQFDGNDDRLLIDDSPLINTDNDSNDGINGIIYNQKSFSMVIKTGDDVNSDQVIFEEGGTKRGYNFMIHNGNFFAGIWNNQEWDTDHQYKSINLGEIIKNTIYFITIVQDSTHGEYTGDNSSDNNFDDNLNQFKIYLNGNLVTSTGHIDPQTEHSPNIGIGALTEESVLPREPYLSDSGDDKYHFNGYIGELIEWNHALTKTEINGLHHYFLQKWYNIKDKIKYNNIEIQTNILNQ